MGRGRAKAKQIKVARKLKYYSPATDLSKLQQELGSSSPVSEGGYAEDYDEDPDYSEYAAKYNDVDDYEDDSRR